MKIQAIDINSKEYPSKLKTLAEPPKVIYCAGDISLLYSSRIMVGVAGARRCSPYGRWVANEIGKIIADNYGIHIGGLAEGIQTATHKGTLERGGDSIAVLGTGIDICFPKSNSNLYHELSYKGLLISEYEPGSSGQPAGFVKRNRIIAALSDKVITVEGSLKSGSAILTELAKLYGKELYAIPGNINQPGAVLPNQLIAEGATSISNLDLVTSILRL